MRSESVVAAYAEPQVIVERQGRVRSVSWPWPLALICGLQVVVSLITLHNTAFQDEALYIYAGRQILHQWNGGPAPLDNYASYFSGYPDLYPVIAGFLDMLGGLEVVRDFSLACMVGVTGIVYWITGRLFGRPAAIFASSVYASTGVVLFVGRLATYDAMCLFLVSVAAAFSVNASLSLRARFAVAIGPVLVCAILAKYAALLFVLPVFGLLVFLSIAFVGWRRALGHLFLALTSFALSLAVAYRTLNREALQGITSTTTNRAIALKEPRIELFIHVLRMGGAIYAVAFFGLLVLLRQDWRRAGLAVFLFGSSWLAPVYHIYMQEPVSLDKHIAYGLFFIAPLAGFALAWVSGYLSQPFTSLERGYWLAGVASVMAILALGLTQSRILYSEWANTSGLTYGLETQVRNGSGRILAEDIEVAQYDAMAITQPWQWGNLYYPYYVDGKGRQLYGDAAFSAAIKSRYYSWIELSFNYLPQQAYFVANQMVATKNYDLVDVITFENSYGMGHFYLWRSALVAGGGDFKSLAQLKVKF